MTFEIELPFWLKSISTVSERPVDFFIGLIWIWITVR
jgi:hypothetical protein